MSQTFDGKEFHTAGFELENRRVAVFVQDHAAAKRFCHSAHISKEFTMGIQMECLMKLIWLHEST